jgi:hypothetical protein
MNQHQDMSTLLDARLTTRVSRRKTSYDNKANTDGFNMTPLRNTAHHPSLPSVFPGPRIIRYPLLHKALLLRHSICGPKYQSIPTTAPPFVAQHRESLGGCIFVNGVCHVANDHAVEDHLHYRYVLLGLYKSKAGPSRLIPWNAVMESQIQNQSNQRALNRLAAHITAAKILHSTFQHDNAPGFGFHQLQRLAE